MLTAIIIFLAIFVIGLPIYLFVFRKSQQTKYNYGFMGKKLAAVVAVALLSMFSIMSVVVLNKQEVDNRTNASKLWSSDINYSKSDNKINTTIIIFQNDKIVESGYLLKVKVYSGGNLQDQKDVEISSINNLTFDNSNIDKILVEIYDGNNLVKSFEKVVN